MQKDFGSFSFRLSRFSNKLPSFFLSDLWESQVLARAEDLRAAVPVSEAAAAKSAELLEQLLCAQTDDPKTLEAALDAYADTLAEQDQHSSLRFALFFPVFFLFEKEVGNLIFCVSLSFHTGR